MGNNNL